MGKPARDVRAGGHFLAAEHFGDLGDRHLDDMSQNDRRPLVRRQGRQPMGEVVMFGGGECELRRLAPAAIVARQPR